MERGFPEGVAKVGFFSGSPNYRGNIFSKYRCSTSTPAHQANQIRTSFYIQSDVNQCIMLITKTGPWATTSYIMQMPSWQTQARKLPTSTKSRSLPKTDHRFESCQRKTSYHLKNSTHIDTTFPTSQPGFLSYVLSITVRQPSGWRK